jgi:hypothetical protein
MSPLLTITAIFALGPKWNGWEIPFELRSQIRSKDDARDQQKKVGTEPHVYERKRQTETRSDPRRTRGTKCRRLVGNIDDSFPLPSQTDKISITSVVALQVLASSEARIFRRIAVEAEIMQGNHTRGHGRC